MKEEVVPCEAEATDATTSRERASHFRNEDALSSAVRKKSATRAALLTAPIVSTVAKLALPTIAVLAAQTLVGIAETYYVGLIGTDALAGTALVFPFWAMMAMMSNGGIGGGVSSAVARAIGAHRHKDADALVFHALALAVIMGATFFVGAIWMGPAIYTKLGGRDEALRVALRYSRFMFAGSIPIWIVNLLSAALRGAGNVRVPALVTLIGACVLIPCSPALIFGFGPIPRLGVGGAGVAVATYYTIASLILIRYMMKGRSGLVLRVAPVEWRLLRDILRVGLPTAVSTIQTNLTVIIVTAGFGLFGIDALAGYGIASRLDYLIIPLMFGLGTAILTMVGVNAGAGHLQRARRIAWTGAIVGATIPGLIGLVASIDPLLWLHIFTHDSSVLVPATLYLRHVALAYGVLGTGLALSYASQGIGRVAWPFVAGTVRMLIAGAVGWLAVTHFGASLTTLSLIVTGAIVAYALISMIPILNGGFHKPAKTG